MAPSLRHWFPALGLALVLASACPSWSAAADRWGVSSLRLVFREDAADLEGLLKGRDRARDDFLTAALGVRLDGTWKGAPAWLEAGLHVATDRDAGRRADVAELGAGRAWSLGPGRLGVRLGVLGVGNFGGQALQNGYHAATDNARLRLAYPRRRVGPLLGLDLAWELPRILRPLRATVSTVDAPAGFHQQRVGLEGRWRWAPRLAVEVRAGQAWRHHLHEDLRSSFQDGLDGGGLLDWEARPGWHLLAWAVANATRRDQSQAGLALGWGPSRVGQLAALALRP